MIDAQWFAWAAGIVDGEGCIQGEHKINEKGQEMFTIRLTVANTDIRMLNKLRELFQGKIRTVYGVGQTGNGLSRKPVWEWRLGPEQTVLVLNILLPWLVVKHEQAELAILSRQYKTSPGVKRSAFTLEQLREIHKRLKDLKHINSPENERQNIPLVQ